MRIGWRSALVAILGWVALLTSAGCVALRPPADPALQLDALLHRKVGPDTPGMAVAVAVAGRVIYARGVGLADLETRTSISPETIFYAASVSKQFTAACLAALVVDGVVDPDAPIRQLLPELAPIYAGVTVRHLVHHTSGIPDFYVAMEREGRHPLFDLHTPDLVMALLNRQTGLSSPPGRRFQYSNSNYFLIARLVERLSGSSLGTFARQRFFEPLGLVQTGFQHDAGGPVPGRAVAYRADGERYVRHQARSPLVGAGGLNTTVLDLIRWDYALASGVFGEELTALMHTRGRAGRQRIPYAWGLQVREEGGRSVVVHGGSLAGFRTALLRYPREQLTVAVLANSAEAAATGTAREIAEAVLTLPRRARHAFSRRSSGFLPQASEYRDLTRLK